MKDKLSIIFETISGSHLYGTNTEESDLDIRGVTIEPLNAILGLQRFEQYIDPNEDRTIYGLRKFCQLALDNNPNIIELLFAPIKCETAIKVTNDWLDILQIREFFLSRKIAKTFVGYAVSQAKRIETHHRWMTEGGVEKPDPFGYGAYIGDDGQVMWSDYNRKQAFENRQKQYEQYSTWLKNRNPKRHELEEKWGYDCYTEDTEFLTESGWKLYSQISDDELIGTINPKTHKLEFQKPNSRFIGICNDDVVEVASKVRTNFRVTQNHKLFVSYCPRGPKNLFSTSYVEKTSNWELVSCQSILGGRKFGFHILCAWKNGDEDELNFSDEFLKLLGAYISEGTIVFNKNGSIKNAVISQTCRGKGEFVDMMEHLQNFYKLKKYEHYRPERKYNEWIWHTGFDLACQLYSLCGHLSHNKCLPFWYKYLSRRQSKILLDSLLLGDGYKKKMGWVYYTNSKKLADDVQFLAINSGKFSEIYGPYKNGMYQVYITDIENSPIYINKNELRLVKYSGNVVCFDVPNGILVTRRNGKIAIQGNTKHGMHLVRLLEQGEELLETGFLTLPRPNAKELLEIRNGKYDYDNLMDWFYRKKEEVNKLEETTTLPIKPNYDVVNQLVKRINYRFVVFNW